MALFAVLLLPAAVWAGGGKDSTKGTAIVLGSYWENYNVNNVNPSTEIDEMILDWRKRSMRDHNFTMEVKQIADWGGMLQTITTSVLAGRPAAQAFQVTPDWALSLYRQKLLAPLSDNTIVNLKSNTAIVGKQVEYNQIIGEIFTFGGKQYALAVGYGTSVHDAGIFFNKRLFR